MDTKLKKEWVDALRSGKYKQTRGKLKSRAGGFCCLGVLCEVMGIKPVWRSEDKSPVHGEYLYDSEECILTHNLRLRAGISPHEEGALIDLNDNGKKFPEIANWIEENL